MSAKPVKAVPDSANLTKFQRNVLNKLYAVPEEKLQIASADPAVKAIFDTIEATAPKSVEISKCGKADVRDLLQLDTSPILFSGERWIYPDSFVEVEPSVWFRNAKRKFAKCWAPTSENTTRTFIDLVMMDVLSRRQGLALRCIGEVEMSYAGLHAHYALSGRGDYCLAYGLEEDRRPILHNILIVGEAKAYGQAFNFWQIIAYMGIVHRKRREVEKANAVVYGFMTDGRLWEFFRIDNDSKVFQSGRYDISVSDGETTVFTMLAYIIDCAERSSPTTSPFASSFDISIETANFQVIVERFRQLLPKELKKWTSEEENEEEDGAQDGVELQGSSDGREMFWVRKH